MPANFDPNKPIPGTAPQGTPNLKPGVEQRHLIDPKNAIQVFKAEGVVGDKVALAAFSVSNYGVYASSEQAVGLYAVGAQLAAEFEGDVKVNGRFVSTQDHVCGGDFHTKGNHFVDGDIQLAGADYAENFDVVDASGAEPGTVMVLDDAGGVRVSDKAYDHRVAGVISGAGQYRPAIILDRQPTGRERRPLALMGKVYCMVDAGSSPVGIGDLLTTSPTPGHAMKAADPQLAFGAVIGKALRALPEGRGLVPILVALQ